MRAHGAGLSAGRAQRTSADPPVKTSKPARPQTAYTTLPSKMKRRTQPLPSQDFSGLAPPRPPSLAAPHVDHQLQWMRRPRQRLPSQRRRSL
jgi:hypothetical protein